MAEWACSITLPGSCLPSPPIYPNPTVQLLILYILCQGGAGDRTSWSENPPVVEAAKPRRPQLGNDPPPRGVQVTAFPSFRVRHYRNRIVVNATGYSSRDQASKGANTHGPSHNSMRFFNRAELIPWCREAFFVARRRPIQRCSNHSPSKKKVKRLFVMLICIQGDHWPVIHGRVFLEPCKKLLVQCTLLYTHTPRKSLFKR